MEMAPTVWAVLSSGGVFFIGVLLSIKISKFFKASGKRALVLYLWHSSFCVAYLLFVMTAGGDAVMYYETSLMAGAEFRFGTAAVQIVTAFFTRVLGLSILGTALCYNLFGFIGLLA